MEQPDTIDIVEYRKNCAIIWQKHQRTTYMLIEQLRNDPEMNCVFDDIKSAQECHAMEHERAMMHYDAYQEISHLKT